MWPGTPSSSRCTTKSWEVRGLTASLASGRRGGYSGTTRSTLSTSRPPYSSMCLRRRWGTSGAQDLTGPNPAAFCGLASSAEGGTVGGSADCRVSFLFPLSSRSLPRRSLTFQSRVVEVFKVHAQDRFLLLHALTHLVLRMRLLHGFFALFPGEKCAVRPAVRRSPGRWSFLARLSSNGSCRSRRAPSSWTPAAYVREEWVDEYDRAWLAAASLPRRWWLLGHGITEDVFWDEPGVEAAEGEGGGRGGAGGVFKVFSRFCSVLWSRTTWRGSVSAVLRRDHLSHCFTWNLDIISTSPLLRHFAHVSCDSPRRLLE